MSDQSPRRYSPVLSNRDRGGSRRQRGSRGGKSTGNPSLEAGLQYARRQVSPSVVEHFDVSDELLVSKPLPLEEPEGMDRELCFICASPVIYYAVAPCNHQTCHICSLRMRALYKNKACAHCRTSWEFVIFTDDEKKFEAFSKADLSFTDHSLGINYAKAEIREDTLLLLRYNCPEPECDVACLGWPDLHKHVKTVHQRVMCDLCTRNKKVFTHEHDLFTKDGLRKHEERGDDKPGTIDQSGFKGHPKCGFCRTHFYSDDELYTHCREKHEKCHICDRRSPGNPQYYLNYDTLEQHFKKDHFSCPEQACLDQKFVVFGSEMDLRAHQLEVHPNGLSKEHRRVDLANFSVRERYQPARGSRQGSRGRGGRGRGKDPNAEHIPQSSAQAMRRDELAFHRQMAIRNSQAVASSLSVGDQFTSLLSSQQPSRTPPSSASRINPHTAHLLGDSRQLLQSNSLVGASTHSDDVELSPSSGQHKTRQLRHQAVLDRAYNLVQGDQSKLSSFRTNISSYTNSSITAAELIEAFFLIFDASSADVGKLVKELGDIIEIPSKKDALLAAWNNWKAINEDYPSLPGSSSQVITTKAPSHGGNRVLRLKNSTARSSKSSVSQTASWGSAAASSGSLPIPTNMQRGVKAPYQTVTTPWASAPVVGSTMLQTTPATRVKVPGKIPKLHSSTVLPDSSAFPALPAAPRPQTTKFTPGYTGFGVRRLGSGPDSRDITSSPWGSRTETSEATPSSISDDQSGCTEHFKRKNQRKKQTLLHFG